MIKNNYLFLSGVLSLLFHFLFIFSFYEFNKKEQEITVLDLSLFKEYKPPQKILPTPKKENKKPDESIIDEKKPLEKKPLEKKPLEKINIKKPEPKVKIKEKSKITEKPKEIKKLPPKKLESSKKAVAVKPPKKPTLNNKVLSKFLFKISQEINLIANKSYPRQSIKRREQGTIVSIVTIDREGFLKEIKFDKKNPKRLYKATEKIIKNYSFPKPPKEILNDKNLLIIKIPVNFILK